MLENYKKYMRFFLIALCMGGHRYASCWGLICFLCSTLVTCWLFHFYIISNVRILYKKIYAFFSLPIKIWSLCAFCAWSLRQQKFTSRGSKGHGSWFLIGGFRSVLCVSVFQGSLFLNFNFLVFSRVRFPSWNSRILTTQVPCYPKNC